MAGEVASAADDMTADHGDERVAGRKGLNEMGGGELGMVGHRVGPTDFEFYPDPAALFRLGEEKVGAGGIAEEPFGRRLDDAASASQVQPGGQAATKRSWMWRAR